MKTSMLVFAAILMLAPPLKAIDVPINIRGRIHLPPCKINNDSDFKVEFGKISLQEIDGNKFYKSVSVTVHCDYFQGKPYIHLSGGTGGIPGAPDNVLNTTGANPSALGIALYHGDSIDTNYPLRLGAGINGQFGHEITKGLSIKNAQVSQYTFSAVPYKIKNTDLIAGAFTASVTMSISYQ
ncbi:fimbrial protein [Salmonella enterica subsp. enterica serovar Braenderup]